MSPHPFVIRPAAKQDLPQLVAMENVCFESDRLSRRSFQRFIGKGTDGFWVAEADEGLAGYILVLYRRGTNLARLYSLAVRPEYRGQGLATRLEGVAEEEARDRGCVFVRLEVRIDNQPAIAHYRKQGYRTIGRIEDYYEDGSAAWRMEKRVHLQTVPPSDALPYYAQTIEFTCGPASLMMAMKAHDPTLALNRRLELQLWREATTIFMTSGHGGCSPHGLALAAWRRGFRVQVYINSTDVPFIEGVRSEDKRAVMALVHHDFLDQIAETDIETHYSGFSTQLLRQQLDAGARVLVLISTYRLSRSKSPHWVLLTELDDDFAYINDPDVDLEDLQSETDNIHVPIPLEVFDRMARFGQRRLRAALIVRWRDRSGVGPGQEGNG